MPRTTIPEIQSNDIVTNDVTLYAHISDEAVSKYMDLTDDARTPGR